MAKDRWVDNRGVRLHYLDSDQPEGSASAIDCVPLVYVPGMLGSAEEFADEFATFASRRCLSLSLRGRGKSDAPVSGYTLEEHASDIEAVVKDAEIEPFCLMAFFTRCELLDRIRRRTSGKIARLDFAGYASDLPQIFR